MTLSAEVAGNATSANFGQAAAEAAALAMLNAVSAQQNAMIALNATVLAAVTGIQNLRIA